MTENGSKEFAVFLRRYEKLWAVIPWSFVSRFYRCSRICCQYIRGRNEQNNIAVRCCGRLILSEADRAAPTKEREGSSSLIRSYQSLILSEEERNKEYPNPRRWRRCSPPEIWEQFIQWYCVTSQITWIILKYKFRSGTTLIFHNLKNTAPIFINPFSYESQKDLLFLSSCPIFDYVKWNMKESFWFPLPLRASKEPSQPFWIFNLPPATKEAKCQSKFSSFVLLFH